MSRRRKVATGLAILAALVGALAAATFCGSGQTVKQATNSPQADGTVDASQSSKTAITFAAGERTTVADSPTAVPTLPPNAGGICHTITRDGIVNSGQQGKLTLPFPVCTEFDVAYHLPNPQLALTALYLVAPGTPILSPIDGIVTATMATDDSWLGPGGVVIQIKDRTHDAAAMILLKSGQLSEGLTGTSIIRGTYLGSAGVALPPAIFGDSNGNVLLTYHVFTGKGLDVALSENWVNGTVNISLSK